MEKEPHVCIEKLSLQHSVKTTTEHSTCPTHECEKLPASQLWDDGIKLKTLPFKYVNRQYGLFIIFFYKKEGLN